MAVVTRRIAAVLFALALLAPQTGAAEPPAESTIDLTPLVSADDCAQVTIEIEVGGTMQVRDNSKESAQERTLPMSVSAKFVYDEHRVAPTTGTLATRAIRYYNEAAAVIKVEDTGTTPKLADDR